MPSREQLKAIKQNEKCFSDSPYALTVALQTKFHTVFILDLAHHYFQLHRAKLPPVLSLYNLFIVHNTSLRALENVISDDQNN